MFKTGTAIFYHCVRVRTQLLPEFRVPKTPRCFMPKVLEPDFKSLEIVF